MTAVGTKRTNQPHLSLLAIGVTTGTRARQLLIAHPDFTNDIEIRPVGLEHKKFPHTHCRLKKNVGDVEIVGNHHQIRSGVVFQNFLQDAFIIQFGLTVRDRRPVASNIERQLRDQTQACRCPCSDNRGCLKPPPLECRERGRLLQDAWPALHRWWKDLLLPHSFPARAALSLLGFRRAYDATK